MSMLTAAAWILAIPIVAIFIIFINDLIFGLFPLAKDFVAPAKQYNATILMPAHNEAEGIVRTITRLKQILSSATAIVVIADNCADDTAELARTCGVVVVERFDAERRGKGFALDFGRAYLATLPPDCVIILDADCVPDPGSVEALVLAAMTRGKPVQAVNLMRAGAEAGPLVEISNFAFMIKNLVRQRGLVRTGGPAMLTGTGMAFPWPIFARLELASSNIVEDLAITVTLTRAATKPELVEAAHVWSESATKKDTLTQRTRWEHGFLGTAARHAVPSMIAGIGQAQLASLRLGLYLIVPPLAMLFTVGAMIDFILGVFVFAGASPVPAMLVAITMFLSLLLLALAWWREGRELLSVGAILRIPLYVFWKVPVYLNFVKGAETEWVRTKRQDRS